MLIKESSHFMRQRFDEKEKLDLVKPKWNFDRMLWSAFTFLHFD